MLSPPERSLARPLSELWQRVGPPLRPSSIELQEFQQTIDDWLATHPDAAEAPRVLVLGATPDLWHLDWPDRSRLVLIEPDLDLATQIWPGPSASVRNQGWLTVGAADGGFDIVLCDAGLHMLGFPGAQAELRKRLFALLPPGGLVTLRLLCPPAHRESTLRVKNELWAGNIPNMSHLMLRVGLSMQGSSSGGVRANAIWLKLRTLCKDWVTLAERLGWSPDDIAIADLYRFSPAIHHYVTLVETLGTFGHYERRQFQMVRLTISDGPLGGQCPVVTFERL